MSAETFPFQTLHPETLPAEISKWLEPGIEAEFGEGVCEDGEGQACIPASVETTVYDKIYNVTLCPETIVE